MVMTMTEGPRFTPMRGHPDDMHRNYYGARLVDAAFQLVDRWRVSGSKPTAPIDMAGTGRSSADAVRTYDELLLNETLSRQPAAATVASGLK